MRPGGEGFSLLETLVALMVLSFLVIGLGQGLRFGLASWDRQTATIGRDGTLDSTTRVVRALVAGMAPGGDPQAPVIVGTADRLAFTAELPMGAPTPFRLADVMLQLDDAGRLILRWTPHLHARLLAAPVLQSVVLLPGVAKLRMDYFRAPAASTPGGWVDRWQDIDPPMLVRLHIGFADSALHWPDLIVAPMRRRDDE